MSTKISLIYNNSFHIYQELNDNGNVYLEVDRDDVVINVKLCTFDEWMSANTCQCAINWTRLSLVSGIVICASCGRKV